MKTKLLSAPMEATPQLPVGGSERSALPVAPSRSAFRVRAVRLDRAMVRTDGSAMRLDDSMARLRGPALRLDDSAMRLDEPAVWLRGPAMRLDDSAMRLSGPAVRLDHPKVLKINDTARK